MIARHLPDRVVSGGVAFARQYCQPYDPLLYIDTQ